MCERSENEVVPISRLFNCSAEFELPKIWIRKRTFAMWLRFRIASHKITPVYGHSFNNTAALNGRQLFSLRFFTNTVNNKSGQAKSKVYYFPYVFSLIPSIIKAGRLRFEKVYKSYLISHIFRRWRKSKSLDPKILKKRRIYYAR